MSPAPPACFRCFSTSLGAVHNTSCPRCTAAAPVPAWWRTCGVRTQECTACTSIHYTSALHALTYITRVYCTRGIHNTSVLHALAYITQVQCMQWHTSHECNACTGIHHASALHATAYITRVHCMHSRMSHECTACNGIHHTRVLHALAYTTRMHCMEWGVHHVILQQPQRLCGAMAVHNTRVLTWPFRV